MFCSSVVACWKRHTRIGDASVRKMVSPSKRYNFWNQWIYTWHSWSLRCLFQYTVHWIFAANVLVDFTLLQSRGTCVRANFWGNNMYATCNNVEWRKTSHLLLIYRIIDGWTSSLVRFRPIKILIFGKFNSKFLQRVAAYTACRFFYLCRQLCTSKE